MGQLTGNFGRDAKVTLNRFMLTREQITTWEPILGVAKLTDYLLVAEVPKEGTGTENTTLVHVFINIHTHSHTCARCQCSVVGCNSQGKSSMN